MTYQVMSMRAKTHCTFTSGLLFSMYLLCICGLLGSGEIYTIYSFFLRDNAHVYVDYFKYGLIITLFIEKIIFGSPQNATPIAARFPRCILATAWHYVVHFGLRSWSSSSSCCTRFHSWISNLPFGNCEAMASRRRLPSVDNIFRRKANQSSLAFPWGPLVLKNCASSARWNAAIPTSKLMLLRRLVLMLVLKRSLMAALLMPRSPVNFI